MSVRQSLLFVASLSLTAVAHADVAKHTTVTIGSSGKATEYTEMVADDNGNLRIEMYTADAEGNRGALDSWMVFQAGSRTLVTYSGGMCQSMAMDGDELPGGVDRAEMQAAQAEMQKALEEMRAQNPEMAKMLEAQMGSSMAAMMGGEPPQIQVIETGEERSVEGYDTKAFRVEGIPVAGDYTVWAADIDDVPGGRTIATASQGMMQAQKQMMENMGIAEIFGNNAFNEILDAMDNYYPILTEDSRGTTRLASTSGGGSDDFNPACN